MSLALTCKLDHAILLKCGEHTVKMTVVATEHRQVRLSFDAPPQVIIAREELTHSGSYKEVFQS